MSFTQDELQAFNSILNQRFSAHQREMEHIFDQRIQGLKREFEQRLESSQQDLLRSLPQYLSHQQRDFKNAFEQKIDIYHSQMITSVQHEITEQQQQQIQQLKSLVENALAAQLLAIEQLVNQRTSAQTIETPGNYVAENIEVQTEVSWEDLVGVVDKALDERFSTLYDSMIAVIKNMERYLAAQLRNTRDDLMRARGAANNGNLTSSQDIFQSIEQLERIIESMQVAMTANHALLSNRLYHHLQLPLERAHSNSHTACASEQLGSSNPLLSPELKKGKQ